ncbi:hypothetical protein BKA70DRAFT_1189506 [Coprinopsis sp. MPI-PUGE-AT-0042]|nr:hypothetical protein BKA70DRAFT_1189506 [Coprinopsis sp. MPI-PUGE-AT-0042]
MSFPTSGAVTGFPVTTPTHEEEWRAETSTDPRREPVLILGTGPAGLITAHTLLQDGFSDITMISADQSVGGVWSRGKVYKGMKINNVHGQFSFSSLPMPPPRNAAETGGRLSGGDMCEYFESFHHRFLENRATVRTLLGRRVLSIRKGTSNEEGWVVRVASAHEGIHHVEQETMWFKRIVVCTGGCSTPSTPRALSLTTARQAGFTGPVVHSAEWWANVDKLAQLGARSDGIVIVGGGKSAQDIATYFAIHHRDIRVTVVYRKLDAFIAVEKPMHPRIRQSRLISILSPSKDLTTWTERLLHKTRLGAWLVRLFWRSVGDRAFKSYSIPVGHPLRLTRSMFWEGRTNDEGVRRDDSFHSLVLDGRINVKGGVGVVSWRSRQLEENVAGVSESDRQLRTKTDTDEAYLLLSDGDKLYPGAVVLCTGFTSSWDAVFDEQTQREIGLIHDVTEGDLERYDMEWNDYETLKDPPISSPNPEPATPSDNPSDWKGKEGSNKVYRGVSALYNGIIPAASLHRRDIAVNGAIVSANAGYAFELTSHYISSYFLSEPMKLPSSAQQALEETVRGFAWLRTRFPFGFSYGAQGWKNTSYAGSIPHFAWPQAMDLLLEDLYLPSWRSLTRGHWWERWTWAAFLKPVQVRELKGLDKERQDTLDQRRHRLLMDRTLSGGHCD